MPSAFVIIYFHKPPAIQICLQPAYKGLTLISPPVTTKQITCYGVVTNYVSSSYNRCGTLGMTTILLSELIFLIREQSLLYIGIR